jgi:Fe-S cluster assembly ATPase SufC
MRLKEISLQRFKRIERVDFAVEDVNILIGANNSGKSTVIQAVHFAFTILQSLGISNKWPVQSTRSSTISPEELIYVPSDDPYSLGHGGRLLEPADGAIKLQFLFDSGDQLNLSVRRGRIRNIIVEPDSVEFAKTLSSLEAPYTIFSPGLAGVSRHENYVSDGVLLRASARGDANAYLRNIVYRLYQTDNWSDFADDLRLIFPAVDIGVEFNKRVDQYISVIVLEGERSIPLDLAGTGLLQCIQILAYFHLFKPKLMIIDEPDSHLHPNNQRALCSLLSYMSEIRRTQVLITTHSRHVLNALSGTSNLLWVKDGGVKKTAPDDDVDLLLDLGALDVQEKIRAENVQFIFLTEDEITLMIEMIAENSGFDIDRSLFFLIMGWPI